MARVKRGVTTHARHKKVLNLAKGYRGDASRQAVPHPALSFSTLDYRYLLPC